MADVASVGTLAHKTVQAIMGRKFLNNYISVNIKISRY